MRRLIRCSQASEVDPTKYTQVRQMTFLTTNDLLECHGDRDLAKKKKGLTGQVLQSLNEGFLRYSVEIVWDAFFSQDWENLNYEKLQKQLEGLRRQLKLGELDEPLKERLPIPETKCHACGKHGSLALFYACPVCENEFCGGMDCLGSFYGTEFRLACSYCTKLCACSDVGAFPCAAFRQKNQVTKITLDHVDRSIKSIPPNVKDGEVLREQIYANLPRYYKGSAEREAEILDVTLLATVMRHVCEKGLVVFNSAFKDNATLRKVVAKLVYNDVRALPELNEVLTMVNEILLRAENNKRKRED